MADDEYEILPHHELEYLRKEVERLKKNPFGDTETGQTLLDSINSLTISINRLLNLLTTANDELVRDYHENKTSDRLERMMTENQKLAQGIVAVGALVKDVMRQQKKNMALQGGFAELSDFTTDIHKLKTNHPHHKVKNPFDTGMHNPADDVQLDSTNLPRQSFSEMDPSGQAGAQLGPPPMPPPPGGANIPSGGTPPPGGADAPPGMPPSFANELGTPPVPPALGGKPPINDDDIPPPPPR